MTDAARFAGDLLRRLIPILSPSGSPAAASDRSIWDEPNQCLDRFLAHPSPSHYLRAARAFDEADQRRRMATIDQTRGRQEREMGLNALRTTGRLDDDLLTLLAAHLPLDRRAGDRLQALAALIQIEDHLTNRVRAEAQALRTRLGGDRRAVRRR